MGNMNVTIPVFPNGDYPSCQVRDCGGLTRTCRPTPYSNEEKQWLYSRKTGDPPVTENIKLHRLYGGPPGWWQWTVEYFFDAAGDGIPACYCKWLTEPTEEDLMGGGSAPHNRGGGGESTPPASWVPAP